MEVSEGEDANGAKDMGSCEQDVEVESETVDAIREQFRANNSLPIRPLFVSSNYFLFLIVKWNIESCPNVNAAMHSNQAN